MYGIWCEKSLKTGISTLKIWSALYKSKRLTSLGSFCHYSQNVQPKFDTKFLPPSRMEDKFIIYSYNMFVTNSKYNDLISEVIKSKSEKPQIDSEVTSLENEIVALVLKSKYDPSFNFKNMLCNLDSKCVSLASKMDISQSLKILSTWHLLLGLKAFNGQQKFYSRITYFWKRKLEETMSPQVIMMLFFASQSRFMWVNDLSTRLEVFKDELTLEELTLVCQCFFKLKMKVPTVILERVTNLLLEEDNAFEHVDTFMLVNILKAMRYSQFWDLKLWRNLSNYIILNAKNWNFTECAHFIAAFANVRYYNEPAFCELEKRGVLLLQEAMKKNLSFETSAKLHGSIHPRSKDIARFLWALSHVHHKCSNKSLECFTKSIETIVANDHQNPRYLIDSLVSLSIYNLYPKHLLSVAFNDDLVQKCLKSSRTKPLHQLYYLHCSSTIENPENNSFLSPDMFRKVSNKLNRQLHKELADRESLIEFASILKSYFKSTDDQIKCLYLLPHIQLASIVISVSKNSLKSFHVPHDLEEENLSLLHNLTSIEILDQYVCTSHNHHKPVGLLVTKIRQLKKLGVKVIEITPDKIIKCRENPDKIIKCRENPDKIIKCRENPDKINQCQENPDKIIK